jgi:hypothetical protein
MTVSREEFEAELEAARKHGHAADETDEIKRSRRSVESRRPPFAQIPEHWVPIVVHANATLALPLLIILANAMRLSRKSRLAITSGVWGKVGYPFTDKQRAMVGLPSASHKRRAMLAALSRVPDIVQLESQRRTDWKYIVRKGKWFCEPPPEA